MKRIRSPQERGYLIPVMRLKTAGTYAKAYAKTLEPVNGRIKVCFDSGSVSTWDAENTKIIENYKIIWSSENLLND